jgi:cation:H+ antiporter
MIIDALFVIASMILLWKGASWLIDSATRIAYRLGISELTVGLTIVALGTSAPEFAVTVTAAFQGHGNISVSNVVGSNIFNLGFILGGVAIVRSIRTSRTLVFRDGLFLTCVILLITFFLWNDLILGKALTLESWEGSILVVLLFLYVGYVLLRARKSERNDVAGVREEEVPVEIADWKDGPLFVLGVAMIVIGGYLLVEGASNIARGLGVSEWVIGVTIVAAGTSTPEFATSLIAVLKGRHGISAGNLIGSDIFNFLGVLGIAALLRPVQVTTSAMGSLYSLLGMVLLVVIFMRTKWQISRLEGVALVVLGALRWIIDFVLRGV